jgi:hypothetical protein
MFVLTYTASSQASLALVPPPDMSPVLTADDFSKLCLSPPLQGPNVGVRLADAPLAP